MTSDFDMFKAMCKRVHDGKYQYSDYSKTKVTVVCLEHGATRQTINSHLTGNGCKMCPKKPRRT